MDFGERGGVGVDVAGVAKLALDCCFTGIGAGERRSCEDGRRTGFDMGDRGDRARVGEGGWSGVC